MEAGPAVVVQIGPRATAYGFGYDGGGESTTGALWMSDKNASDLGFPEFVRPQEISAAAGGRRQLRAPSSGLTIALSETRQPAP